MMKLFLIAGLLVGCKDPHNDAADYASFLSTKASCWWVASNTDRYGDTAVCKVGRAEWYCTSAPQECRVLGPVVQVMTTTSSEYGSVNEMP